MSVRSNEKEAVYTLQDLHNVGTFCNIIELQDLGDKLRMIVMAHRRVRIIGQIVVDQKELLPQGVELEVHQQTDKRNRRRRRNNNKAKGEQEVAATAETADQANGTGAEDLTKQEIESDTTFEPVPVLIVETENIKPIKYAMTTEIKVGGNSSTTPM